MFHDETLNMHPQLLNRDSSNRYLEEIVPHERVIAFRVFTWQINVLIHVESDNMLKADLLLSVHFDKIFVAADVESRRDNHTS